MYDILKNITKHSVIYGIADLINRAVGFVLIPLYTFYLTTADYGTLELLDLTSYIISMFLGMGISQAVFRFYYDYEEEDKRQQVLSVSLITTWVVSTIALIGLFYFSRDISALVFQDPANFALFNIIFVTVVLQLNSRIPLALLRIRQQSILFILVNFILLVINLSLNILFIVHYNMGIKGILLGGLVANIVVGIYLLIFILRRIKISFSFPLLFAMLKYCLPLMWTWVGMFVLHFGDRFILQRLASLSDLGLYSLAYKFGFMISVLILNPFNMMWEPKRFELINAPNARNIYSLIFTYFMYAQVFVGLGIAILIKDVIIVMTDAEFHPAYHYVAVILLAYVLRGAFVYLEFGVHLRKKTKYLAFISLIGAALNVGMNLWLIPVMRIWGCTLTTLLSFLIMLVFIYFISQRLYYIPFESGRLAKIFLTAVIMYVAAYFINLENVFLSIGLKFLIALSFPFVLYLIGFYTSEELIKMSELSRQLIQIIRTRRAALVGDLLHAVFRKGVR
jgi:O-antigen/teichoic acid export membrane protein